MFDLLKLDPRQVTFFQHHVSFGIFEISLSTGELFERVKRDIATNFDDGRLKDLKFTSSDTFATVVVQVYTPYLTTQDIALFLSRYCLEVREGVRILSKHGLWMGRRRFKVRFRTKEDGTTIYPPHAFFLGSDKGFLYVEGQPGACWKCGAVGHRMAECNKKRCRYCGSDSHLAADCTAARTCSACESSSHLFRDCPLRSRNAEQREDGDQTEARGPHGQEEAQGLHLQDEASVAAGAPTVGQEPHLVAEVGAAPGKAGEASDASVAHGRPLGESGAADPADPTLSVCKSGDEVLEGAMLQSTEDAFGPTVEVTFESSLGFPSPSAASLDLSEEGGEEEMPLSGPSVKRSLPVEEEPEVVSRKERRASGASTGSSSSVGSLEDVPDLSDVDSSQGALSDSGSASSVVVVVPADADAAVGAATETAVREAVEWSMEKALSQAAGAGGMAEGSAHSSAGATDVGGHAGAPGSQQTGSVAEVRQTGWSGSPSESRPSSPAEGSGSQVFGAEGRRVSATSHLVPGAGRPSRLPLSSRRAGESAASSGTVGIGRGSPGSQSGQIGPLRSTKGRGRETKGPLAR